MANLHKYEHIKHENYDLCHRNEKKLNQNFIMLKVASGKKFGQHFPLAHFKSLCNFEESLASFMKMSISYPLIILNVIFLKTSTSTLYNAPSIVMTMHRREQNIY
jgi:hypothetical protein